MHLRLQSSQNTTKIGCKVDLLVLHSVILEEEERLEGIKQEVSQVLIQVCSQDPAVVAV